MKPVLSRKCTLQTLQMFIFLFSLKSRAARQLEDVSFGISVLFLKTTETLSLQQQTQIFWSLAGKLQQRHHSNKQKQKKTTAKKKKKNGKQKLRWTEKKWIYIQRENRWQTPRSLQVRGRKRSCSAKWNMRATQLVTTTSGAETVLV